MHYKLALFGNPVEHSISPTLHAEFAHQCHVDISYSKIRAPRDGFREALLQFKKEGGFGCNVTAPFKAEAFQLATVRTERAMIARSVNTLLFRGDDIVGDNTDGVGLLRDIKNNLGYALSQKKILVIGAGGAVGGVLHPLLMEKPAAIIIANRTVENAKMLCDAFSVYGNVRYAGFDELQNTVVDVVIDSTSFNAQIALPDSLHFSENSLFYDLKYNVVDAPMASWAARQHCRVIVDGRGMLHEQAAEAFYVWTGCCAYCIGRPA